MASETQVAYALRIRNKKLHAALVKIAKLERRSLNEIINIACEQLVQLVELPRTKPEEQ